MTTITSTTLVLTDRAARYGKQLTSHLGRRSATTWGEATAHGTLVLADGAATADLRGTDTALVITLTTAPDGAATCEDVIGRHLVRFGHRDEITVTWSRSDGTAGTTQTYDADPTQERS